jgi:hypothetical protein
MKNKLFKLLVGTLLLSNSSFSQIQSVVISDSVASCGMTKRIGITINNGDLVDTENLLSIDWGDGEISTVNRQTIYSNNYYYHY